MKKNVKQSQKAFDTSLISNEDTKDFLTHFLSPFELTALRNNYQQFEYDLNSIPLIISKDLGFTILSHSSNNIKFFQSIIIEAQKQVAAKTIHPEFLSSSLKSHNLSRRLLHTLQFNDCETILDVLLAGKEKVYSFRGIGNKSIVELHKLFNENGCENLFV